MATETQLNLTIIFPESGYKETEVMLAKTCWLLYECKGGWVVLRTKLEGSCAFCSDVDFPCPPKQEGKLCS